MIAKDWNAIVVGGGATGGWAAKKLTEAGLTVLLLEAGPEERTPPPIRCPSSADHLHTAEAANGDPAHFSRAGSPGAGPAANVRQPIQARCYAYSEYTKHLFVDDLDSPYSTTDSSPFTWIRMRVVGGRTVLWNGVALRMSDRQFRAASIDGWGDDWPLSYDDLRSHYDEVEAFTGVYGEPEGFPELPDGRFIQPPPMTETELEFKRLAESTLGWRVLRARKVPIRPSRVDASGAPSGPLGVPTTLEAARRTGRLELRTGAVVSHVITDSPGRSAMGVAFVDAETNTAYEATGQVVVLCASTLETTRILLNSSSSKHPRGLGNSSGALGHFLTDHTFGIWLTAQRGRADSNGERLAHGLYVPRPGSAAGHRRFLRGYGIQIALDGKRLLALALGEMLPRRENHVRLCQTSKDKWGIPTLHIDAKHSQNEVTMAEAQARDLTRLAEAAGWDVVDSSRQLLPPGHSMHEVGTARMGADPRSSVLNSRNQSWEISNLFVVDGASFTSAGYQNPTLTMMALTVRACSYIVERARAF